MEDTGDTEDTGHTRDMIMERKRVMGTRMGMQERDTVMLTEVNPKTGIHMARMLPQRGNMMNLSVMRRITATV